MTARAIRRYAALAVLTAAPALRAFAATELPVISSAAARVTPGNRIASLFLSQDLINEALAKHAKSDMVQDLRVELDPQGGRVFLRGLLNLPVEEMKAVNLDPSLGSFRFQIAIQPKSTRKGHLILTFPLDETFFTPAKSTTPEQDRVIVPVQLLSVALSSVRGYLAAMSGDFSGFDRRTKKLEAQIAALDRALQGETNADARDALTTERDSLKLQLQAVPLERKQLMMVAKQYDSMLGFTGEKELNLNDELLAHKNSLVLRLKLGQFVPYLQGIELGGVRILRDAKDGAGMNFLALDFNAQLAVREEPRISTPVARAPEKVAPSIVIRLNQSLFESTAVLAAEGEDLGPNIRRFSLRLSEDGLMAKGRWRGPLGIEIPFETVLDPVWVADDAFELRLRDIRVAGIDLEVLAGLVLEAAKKRLDASLKGVCTFSDVGKSALRARPARPARHGGADPRFSRSCAHRDRHARRRVPSESRPALKNFRHGAVRD
jgi:hypothetical protein